MPRLSLFTALAAVLCAAIYFLAPQQAPVILYKLNLITLAAVLGYWLDRHIFPYHRILQDEGMNMRMIRRAIVVGATMVAFALAL